MEKRDPKLWLRFWRVNRVLNVDLINLEMFLCVFFFLVFVFGKQLTHMKQLTHINKLELKWFNLSEIIIWFYSIDTQKMLTDIWPMSYDVYGAVIVGFNLNHSKIIRWITKPIYRWYRCPYAAIETHISRRLMVAFVVDNNWWCTCKCHQSHQVHQMQPLATNYEWM